jgi:hypothetical protein
VNNNFLPLNAVAHRHMRLQMVQPFDFAREAVVCPVVSSEVKQIARDYVILFAKEGGVAPLALLGVDDHTNAYVAPSGHWRARYVPAHIRRYPFAVAMTGMKGSSDKREFAMLVDENAPHLSQETGEPLFLGDGKPAPALERIKGALAKLQAAHDATVKMVDQLDAHGLLKVMHLKLRRRDSSEHGITGFRVLDTERLMGLDPQALQTLHHSGALLVAYAHLVSLSNLEDGVLATSQAGSETSESTSQSLDWLLGTIDFSNSK